MKKIIKKIQEIMSKIIPKNITDRRDSAQISETREIETLGTRDMETVKINQKTVAINYDSLLRWAVDLHHTRRNEQSGFQSVTQLLGFTHPHRNLNYKLNLNKNNLRIASKAVFSSLLSAMLPIETRYCKYTPTYKDVKNKYQQSNLHGYIIKIVCPRRSGGEAEALYNHIIANPT